MPEMAGAMGGNEALICFGVERGVRIFRCGTNPHNPAGAVLGVFAFQGFARNFRHGCPIEAFIDQR